MHDLNNHHLEGRVMDLPRPGHPYRLCLLVEDRLEILELLPDKMRDLCDGLSVGDLVRVARTPVGQVATIVRLGGPASGQWDEQGDALRWRNPGQTFSRMEALRLRHQMLRAVRDWFHAQGFLEVETPAWAAAPNPEPQFQVVTADPGHLITSPEFHLKRMLVGGFERIYRIGPVFRGGEAGAHHNPEFTMVEWYRAHAGLEAMATDLEDLVACVAPLARDAAVGQRLATTPFARATVPELFQKHLGLNLRGVTTLDALRAAAQEAGVPDVGSLPGDFERAFFALWDGMEPRFSAPGLPPLLVTDWPAPLASLARLKPDDPTLALRMELYVEGLELANGFDELTDPVEQRRRFTADLAARKAAGLSDVPLDEKFLAALAQGMPPAAGMALGLDRLAMILANASHIRQVLPFAFDER